MNFRIDVDIIIYSYLFICFLMIIFNVFYIFYSNNDKKKRDKDKIRWVKAITEEFERIEKNETISFTHLKDIDKKIDTSNKLLAYYHALNEVKEISSEDNVKQYLAGCAIVYQKLADRFGKKDSMDRAAFAYFISENVPYHDQEYHPIMQILLNYVDDSSVYCRENLIKAFCAFGNVQAMMNFLNIIEDRNLFHHKKLIADGLAEFSGDREELSMELWKNHKEYSENMLLSIISYISEVSDNYGAVFMQELTELENTPEVRLAMIRYFRNHPYEPIKPYLISLLSDERDENADIVAAFVLSSYPCEETIEALKIAIRHDKWYVRQNAANSLVDIVEDDSVLKEILEGKDKYASDMLRYVLAQRGKEVANV